MALAITQVERELDAALQSLNGWAENVLAEEQLHIVELKSAWRQQANHVRELDKLLAQTLIEPPAVVPQAAGIEQPAAAVLAGQATHSRSAEHEKIRAENITRLKQLRRSMLDDLMATVAWVRELVTMIHLAKYTGAPASRAHELVKQIASAVKGLSDVNRVTQQPSA
jgi:phosphoribosylformimino-5-aminoimidazole carboxamide ribonucleotide (ProFAR) isomerase